jgi:uncharacterized protein (DUF1330 family)
LDKAGWLRAQEKVAKPPQLAQSGRLFKKNRIDRSTTPSAPAADASRFFLDVAATPPHPRRGTRSLLPCDGNLSEALDFNQLTKRRQLSAPSSAPFGAKYLVRGGKLKSLEGAWMPKRFVVIEFPSMEKAMEWWDSENYAGAKAIRRSCAKSNFIVVEGI